MMTLNSIIFIDNLPTLDLHGYESDIAKVAINDFINDNYKMKNEFVTIVHGIGSGILRNTTNEVLRKNKKVIEFKSFYYNNGCTVVQIKINDWQINGFMILLSNHD